MNTGASVIRNILKARGRLAISMLIVGVLLPGVVMSSLNEPDPCYRQSQGPGLLSFDLDSDGRLSSDELEALSATLETLHLQAQAEVASNSEADVTQEPEQSPRTAWGLLIRESPDDVALQDGKVGLGRSRGAQLAMTEDMANESRVMSVKGAVLRPFMLGSESRHWLLPSVQINRLTNETRPESEIDSVTFRVGSEFFFDTRQFGVDSLYLRVNPLVTTNFGFDVDVRALEMQLEPEWGSSDLGIFKRFVPVDVNWRLLFQSEYGEVKDAGQRLDLRAGDQFARAGAKVNLDLRPREGWLLDGLVGAVEYEWHQDLGGDLRARKLFTIGLSYALEELEGVTLETRYIKGDSSVALENEETWTVGLGIKL